MAQEHGLINDAREALPAVVQILAEGHDGTDVQSLLNPRYTIPLSWAASGFFVRVAGESGYILTNSHAVTNSRKIKVKSLLTSEELFTAEIVGNVVHGDPDIALLKLKKEEQKRYIEIAQRDLPFIELGNSETLKRGTQVKAIGYPYGMPEPNVSGGEISNFLSGDEESSERLVTDAAINPGNSGGPAIIEGGKVIGINTSIIVNANNIGFITPISFFNILLPSLLRNEEPDLTCLGARFQPNSEGLAAYFQQSKPEGVVISRLVPGGMLERAGLERGDVVLTINEFDIDQYGNVTPSFQYRKKNILDLSREISLGANVTISFWRGGREQTLVAEALPVPSFGVQFQPAIHKRRFMTVGGMLLQELSYELVTALSGTLETNYWQEIEASKYTEQPFLVVTDLDSDSQADNLFLQIGEIINKVGGEPFKGNLHDFSTLLLSLKGQAKELLIEFRSGYYGYFSLEKEFEDLAVKACHIN